MNVILILHILPRVMMDRVHNSEQMAQMYGQLPTLHLISSGEERSGPSSYFEIKLEQASTPQRFAIMSRFCAPSYDRMSRCEGKSGAEME